MWARRVNPCLQHNTHTHTHKGKSNRFGVNISRGDNGDRTAARRECATKYDSGCILASPYTKTSNSSFANTACVTEIA